MKNMNDFIKETQEVNENRYDNKEDIIEDYKYISEYSLLNKNITCKKAVFIIKELLIEVYNIYPYNKEDYNDICLKQYLERQIKEIDNKGKNCFILKIYLETLYISLIRHYKYMINYKDIKCMLDLIICCGLYSKTYQIIDTLET